MRIDFDLRTCNNNNFYYAVKCIYYLNRKNLNLYMLMLAKEGKKINYK